MAERAGIHAEGLIREFKGGMRAVDGIDLEVAPGEIYGFLGPNGAGKSTTVLHAHDAAAAHGRAGASVAGLDVVPRAPRCARASARALQEAALDPLLTGREHMRLQGALHGLGPGERGRAASSCWSASGSPTPPTGRWAATRAACGGGSTSRSRSCTGPRILFLDEPTTGLDTQSRAALWDEVRALASDDGVTVFLTTQYLEEADALADRVGIIDRGTIVAEGTPAELKAEIGAPTLEVVPADPDDASALAAVLGRFGEPTRRRPAAVAVRLAAASEDLADVVRALDAEGLRVATSSCTPPRSTTCSSPRRAARSRARRRSEEPAQEPDAGGERRARRQVALMARRSISQTLRQPALIVPPIVFPLLLVA